MKTSSAKRNDRRLLQASDATILSPTGRVLFDGLRLSLSSEHVALIGRNGVGKSTLLEALSGHAAHERVRIIGTTYFVPQVLRRRADDDDACSHGELRKRRLTEAKESNADFLFLDEPTDDLDEAGVAWLRGWLREFRGATMVASHDRRLLQDFRHFFIARESGCSVFSGALEDLFAAQERELAEGEGRYARSLHRLAEKETHTDWVARRKARKKQYGRSRELARGTPRMRLNQKRDYAQVSHGKLAQIRDARIAALREWSKSTRRALSARLALELPQPILPGDDGRPIVTAENVSAMAGGRTLFESVDLRIARDRIALVGANGAGKTTLLRVLLGEHKPSQGRVRSDLSRIGSIAQGATDWMKETSLLGELRAQDPSATPDELARALVAHKFPLALADRPLRSLSPGERVRAALICSFRRAPSVELLLLDEPTFGLDLFGQRALAATLRAWPGGLVVASHDRSFLAEIGFETFIALGEK